MKRVKGTETEKNLLAAFAGESQARNRYTYFASVAKKEGYEQIACFFLETADNEKEHAKRFFKYLEGGEVQIQAAYPAGTIQDTAANLEAAAAGEHEEWTSLYKRSAEVARKEGFEEIAFQFDKIADVEKAHEKRYRKLRENLKDNAVFTKLKNVQWKCRNCGYIHEGDSALEKCPSCQHPRAYFELFCENY